MSRRIKVVAIGTVIMMVPIRALSQIETNSVGVGDWTWPPLIVIPLLLTLILYSVGIAKMLRRGISRRMLLWPALCFALGWISLVVALDSPLHELGEQLFLAHMTQHEVLMLIAAPLLVLGRPLVPFVWSLPTSGREFVAALGRARVFTRFWTAVSAPLSAWLLATAALWVWHVPWLFDQTLQSDWIHAAQHTTFLATAILFWWPLVNRTPFLGYGGGLIYVFTTILHTTVLGALLTFAQRPWYSSYVLTAPAWHLTGLEDQQLGGLIMWIPAGTLLLIVGLVLLVKWIQESQNRWQYTRMAELMRASVGGAK